MADGIVCYILKKYISDCFPEGSLLNLSDYRRKLYAPHRPSVPNRHKTCICKDCDIAPVFDSDYPYIVRISNSEDRLDVFNRKLEWGKRLCRNVHAYVKLRRRSPCNTDEYAQVIIKYKGSTKIGMKFGVEIVDVCYKGRGEKTVLNYFQCADKCGMLVDLDRLEPNRPNHEGLTSSHVPDESKRIEELLDVVKKLSMQTEILKMKLEEQEKLVNAEKNELARTNIELCTAKEKVSTSQVELQTAEEKITQMADQHEQEMQESEERHRAYVEELKEHHEDDQRLLKERNRELTSLWEVDQNDIEVISNDPIGSGGWGIVYKGKFKGVHVAVKKLYPHILSEHNEKLVRREISLLSQVRHPNILLFVGAVIKVKGESSFIITELLDTDLRSAYGRGEIHEESRLPILSDVAAALVYLHSCRTPIVHRDVSSANVLLEAVNGDQIWKAKLSDFGSANVVAKAITPNPGAAIYAAPETLSEYTGTQQTDKVDVYSFGVLLCETILCSPPPDDRKDFFEYMSRIMSKRGYFRLAKKCTKQSTRDRPPMATVLASLISLKN